MRVIATAPGFFDVNKNGHPLDIKVGQEFEYPDGRKLGKWMIKAKDAPPHPAEIKPPPEPAAGKDKSVI